MKILIESPKDQFQQFIAWMDEQPAGDPIIGAGDTPELALEDLRVTIQRLIDEDFDDENDLILANALLPDLYNEFFQVFIEPDIKVSGPLHFCLDFSNYIFPERR